jgi:ferric-dicitrate binding protein FerR (iron transport regulator)
MPGIDKKLIEDYYRGESSIETEKYLGDAFSDELNLEELKDVFKEQWDNISTDNSEPHQLDYLLHKINYQINCLDQKPSERPITKYINWYARIAAVLLIPLLVFAGIVTFQHLKGTEATGWAEISAPRGTRIRFTLPDGTFGWLNSGSTIKYALDFNHRREVCLKGQAFFQVKHDDDNKFVVKTKYFDIEDVGTAFDVAAYDDEENAEVTLEEGSAILKSDSLNASIEIKPDEQISYSIAKQTFTKSIVTAQNVSAWKEGKLILRNASLEEMAKQLSRWYNVDVRIHNAQHADIRYRATFEDENLNEVLRLLKITTPFDYKIEERIKQADGSFSKRRVLLNVNKLN